MTTSCRLTIDEERESVNQNMYRVLIRSLLYLTASRPNISYVVGVCAMLQANLKKSHFDSAKRIVQYLKGTECRCIWYPRDDGLELVDYSDLDFEGCNIDQKSTSGTCQFLGHKLIIWFSKKQHSVATSIVEAEYVVVGSCCAQLFWIKQQLRDYRVKIEVVLIPCDNSSAIAIAQNPVHHLRTKHIDIWHHFIRYHVEKKDVSISYIRIEKQLADIFTKPLQEERFHELCVQLGLL